MAPSSPSARCCCAPCSEDSGPVRILTLYLSKAFLSSYLVCLFFFVGLFLVIQFFERIDDYVDARKYVASQGASLLALVLSYNLTSVPIVFIQIAPFVTLMGAMFAVTKLSRSNELVPVVTSGVSLYRFLFPIFVYGAVAAVVMILVDRGPGGSRTIDRADRSKADTLKGGGVELAIAGDWDGAHAIAQREETDPVGCWLHACLHKMEGDTGNARPR